MMGVSPSMVIKSPSHKHWQTSSHYPLPSKLQGDGPPVYGWPTPLIYLWLQYIYIILSYIILYIFILHYIYICIYVYVILGI